MAQAATFNGTGDKEVVMQMLKEFNTKLAAQSAHVVVGAIGRDMFQSDLEAGGLSNTRGVQQIM